MRAEYPDRLARLHQQSLIGLPTAQCRNDAVVALPVARRAADTAINDQFARALRPFGIEVVHQHAQRRLGKPRLRGDVCAARRAYGSYIADLCHATSGLLCDTWKAGLLRRV